MSLKRSIDATSAGRRQRDEHHPPVSGIPPATNETTVLEAIDPVRHGAGRDHHGVEELARSQLALDVAHADSVSAAVNAAVTRFGRLDVVVNNAGYGDTASVEDVTLDDFRAQIDTNFYGVIYVSKAALPVLRQQGSGHIIQISSLGGRIAGAGLSAYQSAKWAVGGLSVGLAQEVAPFGVKVTVLEPSGMRTDWAGSSMTIPPISEPYQQTLGAFAEMIRQQSGTEPSDPAKVADLVRKVVDLPEPPVRLLVGSDAVEYVAQANEALADSDATWLELSKSVGFDSTS